MSGRSRTRVRITGPEIDLSQEVIVDSRGRRVDQAYVDESLAEVEDDVRRRAGRPSLTGASAHSPHVTFRVTPEMKARAEAAALEQGITVSALARLAFERFLSA
jgi:predicted HicB family RNase H-like nuclease